MDDAAMTLERIVADDPRAAEVFIRLKLDFCCRGRRTLVEACAEAGLRPEDVRAELARAATAARPEEGWSGRPLAELVDHILERYHAPLRRELPGLLALALQVEHAHAERPTCPRGLSEHLARVQAAVEDHLGKEERVLFPLIRAGRAGTAHMPVKVMMQEHEDHGDNLRRTRALTADLVAPPEACASWRELYRGLARLEADLFRHIHLENYVLFPRALGERPVEAHLDEEGGPR